jgi:hypothetical protein
MFSDLGEVVVLIGLISSRIAALIHDKEKRPQGDRT